MKKIFALAIAGIMTFSLAACGSEDEILEDDDIVLEDTLMSEDEEALGDMNEGLEEHLGDPVADAEEDETLEETPQEEETEEKAEVVTPAPTTNTTPSTNTGSTSSGSSSSSSSSSSSNTTTKPSTSTGTTTTTPSTSTGTTTTTPSTSTGTTTTTPSTSTGTTTTTPSTSTGTTTTTPSTSTGTTTTPDPEPTPEPEPEVVVNLADVWTNYTNAIPSDQRVSLIEEGIAGLSHFYGISSSDVEEAYYYRPMMNTKADEVVILQAKSGNVSSIKSKILAYQKQIEASWAEYLPDQYELVLNYTLVESGDYILFYVGENAGTMVSAFNSVVK